MRLSCCANYCHPTGSLFRLFLKTIVHDIRHVASGYRHGVVYQFHATFFETLHQPYCHGLHGLGNGGDNVVVNDDFRRKSRCIAVVHHDHARRLFDASVGQGVVPLQDPIVQLRLSPVVQIGSFEDGMTLSRVSVGGGGDRRSPATAVPSRPINARAPCLYLNSCPSKGTRTVLANGARKADRKPPFSRNSFFFLADVFFLLNVRM